MFERFFLGFPLGNQVNRGLASQVVQRELCHWLDRLCEAIPRTAALA